MWEHRAIVHHAQLTEHITVYDPATQATMSQLGDPQTSASLMNQMITQQGFQISFNEVFYMLGWVFVLLIFVVWLARPPFTAKAAAAAGGH
jgi:DHA2 family multidrug resistance protein